MTNEKTVIGVIKRLTKGPWGVENINNEAELACRGKGRGTFSRDASLEAWCD